MSNPQNRLRKAKWIRLALVVVLMMVILTGFVFDINNKGIISEAIARFMTILIAAFTGLLMVFTRKLAEQQRASNNLKQKSNDIESAKIKLEERLRAERKEQSRKHDLNVAIGLIQTRTGNVFRKLRKFRENDMLDFKQWVQENQNKHGKIDLSKCGKFIDKQNAEYLKFFKEISEEENLYMKGEYSKLTGQEWTE